MNGFTKQLVRFVLRKYPFNRGKGRIFNILGIKKQKFEEKHLVIKTRHGFMMKIIPNDYIGKYLYYTGAFDDTIFHALSDFCQGDETILDVGGNIGYISCCFLDRFPDCRIISIEPQNDIFFLLKENMERISKDRGQAVNAALSDHGGEGYMESVKGNIGACHIVGKSDRDLGDLIQVRLINGEILSQLVGTRKFDIVKIDVEGHEEEVLRSLYPMFKEHRPKAIAFEHFKDLNAGDSVIRKYFEDLNYEIKGLRNRLIGWEALTLGEMARRKVKTADYIATPRSC